MKKRVNIVVAALLALLVLLSACTNNTSDTQGEEDSSQTAQSHQTDDVSIYNPTESDEPTPSSEVTTGAWYESLGTPQYGGEIVFASNRYNELLDVYTSGYSINYFFLEPLFIPDWGVDRTEYGFKTNFIPNEHYKGCLAESYEVNGNVITVHLREDVYWQDKEPVNGRQFVANDVVYHYSRLAGIGTFEGQEPSPQCGARLSSMKDIIATDDFTVEFTFESETPNNVTLLLEQDSYNHIMAPEVIDMGVGEDWKYAVGTGPWILQNLITGNTVTFTKNPDYWGCDERYPENKLPYADTLKVMLIKDPSTKLAALRSGGIDFADELSLQQYTILEKSDNDLITYKVPFIATNGLQINMNVDVFSDKKVRQALQMAIDRDTLAAKYFGESSALPAGWVNPNNSDYAYNYAEWPEDLQSEYSYNPERAKELLAAAGYPDGFAFTALVANNDDLTVLVILKSYFMAIGVDMTIYPVDFATANALSLQKKYEAYWTKNTASGAMPYYMVRMDYSTASTNYCQANDPEYDALCEDLLAATSDDEIKRLCILLDKHVIENHWGIRLFPTYIYNVSATYINGYSGENIFRMGDPGGWLWARLWTTK